MIQAPVRDEFDAVVVPPDGRRGAHRARAGRARSVLPSLAVGLVAVVAGATTVTLIDPSAGAAGSSSAASASGSSAVAADAAATATTGATSTSAAATSAAGSSSAAGSTSAAATTSAARTSASTAATSTGVLRSTPVVVLNTTGTAGLASRTAAKLHAAGWTVASTGNASLSVRSTIVEYVDPSLAATAASVAASVGGTATHVSALSSGRLVVVLGPGAS